MFRLILNSRAMSVPKVSSAERIPGFRQLPVWLRPYVFAVLGVALVSGFVALGRQAFGTHLTLPIAIPLSFLFLLIFLGAAWLSYGAGIMVCLLNTVAMPHLIVVNRLASGGESVGRPDAVRLGLLIGVSLLVSYIGGIHRRRESELRRQAEELVLRVRERTDQLLVSALEKRQAEDRLRFVLDSADVGYWDYDLGSGVTIRSPTHDRVFGYDDPLPDWNYRTFLRHVHPEDRAWVGREVRSTMEGNSRSLEFRIVWPDGSVHWLWAKVQTHLGPTGAVAHLGGVVVDVTARRRAEEDLRDQAQLLELAHDAILTLDRQGQIRFWSRGAEQMYGFSREEALGSLAHELLENEIPGFAGGDRTDSHRARPLGGRAYAAAEGRIAAGGGKPVGVVAGHARQKAGLAGNQHGYYRTAQHRRTAPAHAEAGKPGSAGGRRGARLQQPPDRHPGQRQPGAGPHSAGASQPHPHQGGHPRGGAGGRPHAPTAGLRREGALRDAERRPFQPGAGKSAGWCRLPFPNRCSFGFSSRTRRRKSSPIRGRCSRS